MRLSHLHIPRPIPYTYSLKLQEALLEKHFAYKTALRSHQHDDTPLTTPPPPPTLLTFQTHPTYTVGRRHLNNNPLSQAQISFLTGASPPPSLPHDTTAKEEGNSHELATFYPSPRGGLLTYHAPGQLTAYLIIDLRRHNLTPRCYIRMLENSVMRTCARHGVPNTLTTDDPGVWIGEPETESESESLLSASLAAREKSREAKETDEVCNLGGEAAAGMKGTKSLLRATDRKICAIGVHVSRGITSHGVGLNVFDAPIDILAPPSLRQLYTLPGNNKYLPATASVSGALESANEDAKLRDSVVPAQGYLSWGFSRIVACGLEGKSVTWLSREQGGEEREDGLTLEAVAGSLAKEVASSLGIKGEDAVVRVGEEVVLD